MRSKTVRWQSGPKADRSAPAYGLLPAARIGGSEPISQNASSIARQVFEGVETLKMVNRQMRDSLRFGHAQIHGDSTPPLLVGFKPSPIRHAATFWAEMKLDRLAPNVRLGRTRNLDPLPFVVVGPQRSVATAHGAITRGR